MVDAILTLIRSKRFLSAVIAVIIDIALVFGLKANPEIVGALVLSVSGLAAILIAAFTSTDKVNAMTTPEGYDHKGRFIELKDGPKSFDTAEG